MDMLAWFGALVLSTLVGVVIRAHALDCAIAAARGWTWIVTLPRPADERARRRTEIDAHIAEQVECDFRDRHLGAAEAAVRVLERQLISMPGDSVEAAGAVVSCTVSLLQRLSGRLWALRRKNQVSVESPTNPTDTVNDYDNLHKPVYFAGLLFTHAIDKYSAWRIQAVALLFAVAGIHFFNAAFIYSDWIWAGVFTTLLGTYQLAAAFMLYGGRRAFIVATFLATLVNLGVSLMTVTLGLPVGPTPGQPEALTPIMIVENVLAIVLLLHLFALATHSDEEVDSGYRSQ